MQSAKALKKKLTQFHRQINDKELKEEKIYSLKETLEICGLCLNLNLSKLTIKNDTARKCC